jgi:nucleoid-associated protein YgaU
MKAMWSGWRSGVKGWLILGGCAAVVATAQSPAPAADRSLTRAEAQALQQEFQQRYQRLEGMVQDLVEGQAALSQRLDTLAASLAELERRVAEPAPEVVTQEQLKQAVEALRRAVEKQQAEQNDQIMAELKRLQQLLAKSAARPPRHAAGPRVPTEGYDYTIQSGDTLSAIVDAYRKAGVKGLTVDLVLRANKGLKPERLIPGQKIFIPDPGK